MKRIWLAGISILLFALTFYVMWTKYGGKYDYESLQLNQNIIERTLSNYQDKIEPLAKKYDLPSNYLLALIALECSGRKVVPHRFESHVHSKLLKVKSGELKNLENVESSNLKNADKQMLKELASSWGPFQLMGYKCFNINVKLVDLKNGNSLESGVKWIDKNYGELLRRGQFKDAFHLHNTGRKHPRFGPPRTYHADYVPKGLKYMDEISAINNNPTSTGLVD
jgi:hypothetical protein